MKRFALPLAAAGTALVTFLLMPGGGTYALWNGVAAAKAGAITAATVAVSVTIPQPFDTVFKTGHTTTTGGVVVTNTGNVAATFGAAATLASGTSPALASAIGVTAWPAAGAASCTSTATPPSGSYTGTLTGLAALGQTTGALPAGASAAFCVRESMNVASAPGIASGSAVNVAFSATVTAGTSWSASASASIAQTFVDDIAPSAPTALTVRTSTSAPVALSWAAATDNVGVTRYDVYRSGTIAPIGSTTSTSFTDTGAAANTSYTYTVYARDAVLLTSPGAGLSVDRTAPTTPTLALLGSTGSSATLSFASTDNVGVSAYTIYRDGAAIATVGGATTGYTDTGLTVGLHRYTVAASDAAGNLSPSSAAVSAVGSYASGSWYQLVNAASGQCVTVGSPIADGTVLTQSACASPVNDGQAWRIVTFGSTATVTVTSALPTPTSSQYLWAGSRKAPVAVTSSGTSSTGSTQWTFDVQADGSFILSNTITGNNGNGNGSGNGNTTTLCATAAAAGGGQLTTTTCTAGASTQSFFLRQVTP